MKKYGNIYILTGYVILMISMFFSIHVMYIIQGFLFALFTILYLIDRTESILYIGKLKYIILINVLLFFFVFRNRDGGYWGVDELNLLISDIMVFAQSVLLLYLLIRIDRLSKVNIEENDMEEETF